jgi:hypothetical protein
MKPSTFDNLVAAIGREAAEKLLEHFGGTRLYVPVRVIAGSPLTIAIGDSAAAGFSRHFGGECLQIPVDPEWGRLRGRIVELHRAGHSTLEITRHLRCSRRYVLRILAEPHSLR